MPRYNVLLRDDKSFPFIHLTAGHDFPQLTKHRGARGKEGSYFGPFASAGAVNRTLVTLQKAFLLRSCSDSIFATRTRPCLLYQIKRCSAPCVGRIGREDYAALIEQARIFLSGRSDDVQQRLAVRDAGAAEALDFEAAALIRDRSARLSLVQGHQDIHVAGVVDADVIAAHQAGGQTCVQVSSSAAARIGATAPIFPATTASFGRGGADLLCRPILRQPAEAAAGAAEPSAGRAGSGRGGTVARRRQGDAGGAAARRQEKAGRPHCRGGARGARPAPGGERLAAPAARRRRRGVQPRRRRSTASRSTTTAISRAPTRSAR